MRRYFAALIIALAAALAGTPIRAAEDVKGFWRGTAVLGSDSTPIAVEVASCPESICVWFSLPEIGYQMLKPTKATFADGSLNASPLRARLQDGELVGELSGVGGGLFIDALGHGGKAVFRLTRAKAPDHRDLVITPVRFRNGDVEIAGSFVKPRGRGPFPTIVSVHGSGPSTRWLGMDRAMRFAEIGFATLVFDKRGLGESGGDWTATSLDDLALDAVAAVKFVAARPDVDPRRIGFWGHSQGGWVIPRAARLGAPVSFAIVGSGGGLPPRTIEQFDYSRTLGYVGATEEQRAEAQKLIDGYFDYLDGRTDFTSTKALIDARQGEGWARALGLARVLPVEAARDKWSWVARYDPKDDIAALRIPMLVILGTEDRPALTDDMVAAWSGVPAAQGASMRIVVYPGADHHLRIPRDGGWARTSADYWNVQTDWLRRVAGDDLER